MVKVLRLLLLRGTVFAYRGDSVVKEDNVMLEDKEDNNKLLMLRQEEDKSAQLREYVVR